MNNSQKEGQFNINSLNPTGVCLLVTIIAIIGAFVSLSTKNPLWILVFLLTTTIYEAICTQEGVSIKFSSILLLVILILEILLVVFILILILLDFLGRKKKISLDTLCPWEILKFWSTFINGFINNSYL